MNIKEAKIAIQNTVKAYTRKNELGHYVMSPVRQRPVLLIGPPGIGKTAIMEQVAKECGIGLVAYTITHHTRQSAVGLPVVVKKNYQGRECTVTEYTMSEIIASVYECMEKTGCREGILFIDEINCVSETLTPTMLQFLQCKTFGTHAVPEGWVIVAAGNPSAYNKSAREFDIVTLDRVKRMDVEADFEVWKEYAYENGIHPVILSYLNLKKEHFYYVETQSDKKAFVTARGWEDLSEMLKSYEEMAIVPDEALAFQYIQEPEIAADFARFYQLYEKYGQDYQVDRLLDGSMEPADYEAKVALAKKAGIDERLTLTGMILAGWNQLFALYGEKNAYAQYLHGTFSQVKKELEQGQALQEILEKKRHALQVKSENGLLSFEEEAMEGKALSCLEECRLEAAKVRLTEPEEIMDVLRAFLKKVLEKREALVEEIQNALERGFAFTKEAFGEGTEMTFLMNDLSQNQNAMQFISTFGNETYFSYSDHLKVSQKRQKLLEKIERLTHE